MPCAIPLIVNKEEPVFGYTGYERPSETTFKGYKGYTGYTGSTDYEKTIKTITFAFGDKDKVCEPTEYTNSSDKPYHYPFKGYTGFTSYEFRDLTPEKIKGYTGFTCYDRPAAIKPNGYTGGREYHKYLKEAVKPIIGFTGSIGWEGYDKIDDYLYKDNIKILKATPEKPKVNLWQVIQVMLFDYICSINNRYNLNIPLDIVV